MEMEMMAVWLRARRRPWKEAVVEELVRVAGWNSCWRKERATARWIVIEHSPGAG
jgi:hypothetical protein